MIQCVQPLEERIRSGGMLDAEAHDRAERGLVDPALDHGAGGHQRQAAAQR